MVRKNLGFIGYFFAPIRGKEWFRLMPSARLVLALLVLLLLPLEIAHSDNTAPANPKLPITIGKSTVQPQKPVQTASTPLQPPPTSDEIANANEHLSSLKDALLVTNDSAADAIKKAELVKNMLTPGQKADVASKAREDLRQATDALTKATEEIGYTNWNILPAKTKKQDYETQLKKAKLKLDQANFAVDELASSSETSPPPSTAPKPVVTAAPPEAKNAHTLAAKKLAKEAQKQATKALLTALKTGHDDDLKKAVNAADQAIDNSGKEAASAASEVDAMPPAQQDIERKELEDANALITKAQQDLITPRQKFNELNRQQNIAALAKESAKQSEEEANKSTDDAINLAGLAKLKAQLAISQTATPEQKKTAADSAREYQKQAEQKLQDAQTAINKTDWRLLPKGQTRQSAQQALENAAIEVNRSKGAVEILPRQPEEYKPPADVVKETNTSPKNAQETDKIYHETEPQNVQKPPEIAHTATGDSTKSEKKPAKPPMPEWLGLLKLSGFFLLPLILLAWVVRKLLASDQPFPLFAWFNKPRSRQYKTQYYKGSQYNKNSQQEYRPIARDNSQASKQNRVLTDSSQANKNSGGNSFPVHEDKVPDIIINQEPAKAQPIEPEHKSNQQGSKSSIEEQCRKKEIITSGPNSIIVPSHFRQSSQLPNRKDDGWASDVTSKAIGQSTNAARFGGNEKRPSDATLIQNTTPISSLSNTTSKASINEFLTKKILSEISKASETRISAKDLRESINTLLNEFSEKMHLTEKIGDCHTYDFSLKNEVDHTGWFYLLFVHRNEDGGTREGLLFVAPGIDHSARAEEYFDGGFVTDTITKIKEPAQVELRRSELTLVKKGLIETTRKS